MPLKGSKTALNLMHSFAGETQAHMRYLYYASEAKKEGYVQIQNIFEETARNEKEHAKRFYKFLREEMGGEDLNVNADFPVQLSDTLSNLAGAYEGECHEAEEMYPEFAKVADEEGFEEIARTFREIAHAEKAHEIRFRKLYENIQHRRVFKRDEPVRWKCNNCGYIHEGTEAPDVCPACIHEREYFEIFVETY